MKAYLKEQPFVEKRRIEKISSLEWDFKKKIFQGNNNIDDIAISKVKLGKKYGHGIVIRFENEVEKIIDPEGGEYIATCIEKNRIYFMPHRGGYKICRNKCKPYIRHTFYEKYSSFLGTYELKYDEGLRLYFIEREANR